MTDDWKSAPWVLGGPYPPPSCPHIDHIRSRYRRIRDLAEDVPDGDIGFLDAHAKIVELMRECEEELEIVRSINARLRADNKILKQNVKKLMAQL